MIKVIVSLVTLSVFMVVPVFAQDLTKTEETLALQKIEQFYSKKWNTGDFQYHFSSLDCNFQNTSCTLNFSISKNTTIRNVPEKFMATIYQYGMSCTVLGVKSFQDIVQDYYEGTTLLNDFFAFKLDRCVTFLEAKVF